MTNQPITNTTPCKHKRVVEYPGEPTIGPYYVCKDCGRQLAESELP